MLHARSQTQRAACSSSPVELFGTSTSIETGRGSVVAQGGERKAGLTAHRHGLFRVDRNIPDLESGGGCTT